MPKTRPTGASVTAFLNAIPVERIRKDARAVAALLKRITGEKARLWGKSIVGYGSYESRTGDWPLAAFAPRKGRVTLYLAMGFTAGPALLKKLGRHQAGQSCLHLTSLSDVNLVVLEELVRQSVQHAKDQASA
jgi:hypothetical protein